MNVPTQDSPLPCLPFLAHRAPFAKQALLLTGTGVTNQAALHASGLNAEEAKRHFREAVESGEEGVAGPAAEALEWCEMEVRRWGGADGRCTRAAARDERACTRAVLVLGPLRFPSVER